MRRILFAAALASLVVSTPVVGQEGTVTVTGEVIDMLCYARLADDATGPEHAACALKCARSGTAVGIRTEDALLTIIGELTDNDNAKLLDYVGKKVQATGKLTDGGGPGTRIVGKRTIEVTSIKLAAK